MIRGPLSFAWYLGQFILHHSGKDVGVRFRSLVLFFPFCWFSKGVIRVVVFFGKGGGLEGFGVKPFQHVRAWVARFRPRVERKWSRRCCA